MACLLLSGGGPSLSGGLGEAWRRWWVSACVVTSDVGAGLRAEFGAATPPLTGGVWGVSAASPGSATGGRSLGLRPRFFPGAAVAAAAAAVVTFFTSDALTSLSLGSGAFALLLLLLLLVLFVVVLALVVLLLVVVLVLVLAPAAWLAAARNQF